MTNRHLGIGTAALALALTAGVAIAERADVQAQGATPPQGAEMQRGLGPGPSGPQGMRPGGPGQVGPDQGQGRGRGPGGVGPGRGMGPGQGPDQGPGQGAGRAGRGPGRGVGPGTRLDLTDDQRIKIEALHRTARDQSASVADELEFTRRTLHREVFAEKRDNAKVATLAAKIATLEKQLVDVRLKTETAVADLLTPAQRETMRLQGGGPDRPGPAGRGRGVGRGGPAGPA